MHIYSLCKLWSNTYIYICVCVWEYQSNTTRAGKKNLFTLVPWKFMARKPSEQTAAEPFPQFASSLYPVTFQVETRFPPDSFPPKKKSEHHFFCGFQNWCSFPTPSLADLILTLTYLFSLSKFQVCVPEVSLDAGRISSPIPPHPRKFWTGPKMKHVWGIQSEIAYVVRKSLDDFIKLSFGEE